MSIAEIEAAFPGLSARGYDVTSQQTPFYNCIAWAAGDSRRWWWPVLSPMAYWPPSVPREETLKRFVEAFGTLGHEPCDNSGLEPGFEKVAIYAIPGGSPTHAARQLPSGYWTSKLGKWEDIEHHTIDGVESRDYGVVVQVLKRPIIAL